ncbi:disease resistance protein [Corchorus capsularis]|uniref:Disease resistance protein n=1 Tax=Corchorus capsularis TaxID=210143 RepID=A0A1R3GWG4_COCAP|nr:disease resistance protein [Corchorus capsularis]
MEKKKKKKDNLASNPNPCFGPASSGSSPTKFVFPQVRYLKFESLSKLKYFYPSMITSEWPALTNLVVTDCPYVEAFSRKSMNVEYYQDEYLFWFSKEAFPLLEEEGFGTDELGNKYFFGREKKR